jgi:maleylacetate reductase
VGDRLKLASVLELFTYLPRVRRRSDDLEARLRCQIGAWLADHSPLRAQDLLPTPATLPSHAFAYELGALCRVPYALTACLTLPACMRWAAANSAAARARQAQLARALEVAEADTPDEVAARLLAGRVRSFIENLRLPTRLRDAGISNDDVARLARQFMSQGGSLVGSASATGAEVLSLLESAW